MKIKRPTLLQQIIVFFRESGVVVGDPGVGKSYLLSQVVTHLIQQGIPATLIRMDYLSEGSDKEISDSLGITSGGWIEALKRIIVPDQSKGLLIFDAFDAVRDEKLRLALLNQISKAKRELPNWSIVVSVRTYDASRSQKLLDLFPQEYNSDNIHCRRFIVPALTDEELQVLFEDQPKLKQVYEEGSEKLKAVLKVPFFLVLLDTILNSTDIESDQLKSLKSEIELLELYWIKVVLQEQPTIPTELFLTRLTKAMVDKLALSVDKLDHLSNEDANSVLIAERLLRNNVLAENGVHTSRLAYAHNILFDYAVSKLVLKDDASELLKFISLNQARPFFLRPSFIYLFAGLWYFDQEKFWLVYNELSKSTDEVIILLNKLIPSTVIVKEFDNESELRFSHSSDSNSLAQVGNFLQALRFLKDHRNAASKAKFMLSVSTKITREIAWDFSYILAQLINNPEVCQQEEVFNACGKAARNLFDFAFSKRSDQGLDNLASNQAVELVSKTYHTDKDASRERLRKVLAVIDEPGFNIRYISNLTEYADRYLDADLILIAEIYRRVFGHQENSHEATPMLQSVLMNFQSNRHDMYGLCLYRLTDGFPRFILKHPKVAIPLALEIASEWIKQRNTGRTLITETGRTPFEFQVNGVTVGYQVDFSQMWADRSYMPKEPELMGKIFDYFQTLIASDRIDDFNNYLSTYVAHAKTAFHWKMLLQFAAENSVLMREYMLDVLLQPAILYWGDTTEEAVILLEKVARDYNSDQLLSIENVIQELPSYAADERERGWIQDRVIRLLQTLPTERLKSDRAKDLMAELEKFDEPSFDDHQSERDYTSEDELADIGVDVKAADNAGLIIELDKMRSLISSYNNHTALPEVYLPVLQVAIESFKTIKGSGTISKRMTETMLTSIAGVCEVVARSAMAEEKSSLSREMSEELRSMILYCLDTHTEGDTFAAENSSVSGGFSSTPRSNAANAFPPLYYLTNDKSLLPIMVQCSMDPNPICRFGVIKYLPGLYNSDPDIFWQIVDDRSANETDYMNKSLVIKSIGSFHVFKAHRDKFIAMCESIKGEIADIGDAHNIFSEAFFIKALLYWKETSDPRMAAILMGILTENSKCANQFIFNAFKIIEPENLDRNYSDPADVAKSQKIIDLLLELLKYCENVLTAVKPGDTISDEVKNTFYIMDEIVKRTYFSLQVQLRPNSSRFPIGKDQQAIFYFFVKPLLEYILKISRQLDRGHVQGHTAHHFIQIMGEALDFDTKFSLDTVSEVTEMTVATGYTFDYSAMEEIVKYTERLLSDHRQLLQDPEEFGKIMKFLNLYAHVGWPQALQLLWKLDEIFR